MVGRWGMSTTIGPITVLPDENQGPLLPGASETSQDTQRIVDEEVHKLVEAAHHDVTQLLEEHRDQLENLAQALLKAETLDAPAAYTAAGVPMSQREPAPAPA
jgi:cell division protease FtsH